FLKNYGMPGNDNGQFDRPNGIAVANDGSFYVSDSNNLRIQAFDAQGKFRWVKGKPQVEMTGMKKSPDREFGLPRNMKVGPDGNIYVMDAFDYRIRVYTPEGKLLAAMGKRGTEDGYFNFPNGIAITQDKVIYIADKENNRVQAIRLTGFEIEKD
ncbi:MAG TPA: SMP-30/gluconolactonase/LRE family protein, partial [Verrucomicrobiae bacterium]|nr:SMP-30/gluconolactonase/LRE family protein [Verrucomicrobiae bacterium]